jgi:hypothetical protein
VRDPNKLSSIGLTLASVALLTACGFSSPPGPVVDHTGIDEGAYSRDLAACYNERPFVTFGAYISRCLTQKGYKVLYGQ